MWSANARDVGCVAAPHRATLWFRSGVNPKVVQETLGHSRVAITLDSSSHMILDLQTETARVVDELFRAEQALIQPLGDAYIRNMKIAAGS